MKKLILEALKTKFEGVSEQILGRMAEKLAKTTTKEEEITTAVEGVTFQSLLEQYGDSRATEAQQTAVKNYETKYNIKDGKPVTTTTVVTEPSEREETPEWAKALIESNKQLKDELNAIKVGKVTDSRKKELSEIIKTLPEPMRKAYERTPVESLSEEEFTTLKTDIKSEVEKIGAEIKAKGSVFGAPRQGGSTTDNKPATDAEVKAVVDQIHV